MHTLSLLGKRIAHVRGYLFKHKNVANIATTFVRNFLQMPLPDELTNSTEKDKLQWRKRFLDEARQHYINNSHL